MSSPTSSQLATDVGAFFDQQSSEYDQSIRRLIPHYQEIFETLITYSFLDRQAPIHILELGCGSGNLSLLIAHLFPNAQLTLVDLSSEMLIQAKSKLAAHAQRITFHQANFLEADLPENRYDFAVSSFALHHLPDPEKQIVYPQLFRWLKPGGVLRIADGTAILPEMQGSAYLLPTWFALAKEAGASEEECKIWMDHTRQFDHFASLDNHFRWLGKAGFIDADCYWKKLHLAVFGARKPNTATH